MSGAQAEPPWRGPSPAFTLVNVVRPPTSQPTGSWVPAMKAVGGPIPDGPDWAFELKWDGIRLQAHCSPSAGPGRQLDLRSISGRNVTSTYPELAPLGGGVGLEAVVDGEVVVFDGDRPSFGLLQHRMHVDEPTSATLEMHPVVYIAFDLLALDGRSLLDLPYSTRRRFLNEIIDDGPNWRCPPASIGDGTALLDLAHTRDLEGVMAKRRSSRYQPGVRSRDWIKIKIRKRQEFVVGGLLPGRAGGALSSRIGSLLLGVYHGHELHFVGAAGSGLTDTSRHQLSALFKTAGGCPFVSVPPPDRTPIWVEPTVVVEVAYSAWPAEGHLRHPVYAGLRRDHDPNDVVRELPPGASDVG